jgi:hypothetical protein
MDLKTVKARYGHGWAWARTGALILFLLTGILLVASLTSTRHTATGVALQTGTGLVFLKPSTKTATAG